MDYTDSEQGQYDLQREQHEAEQRERKKKKITKNVPNTKLTSPMDTVVMRQLVRAAVRAFAELNRIRARDGVPYTRDGYKSSVDEEYFGSVVDGLDEAVKAATGESAHCHPELYI